MTHHSVLEQVYSLDIRRAIEAGVPPMEAVIRRCEATRLAQQQADEPPEPERN